MLASYAIFQNHLPMVADYPSAYRGHPALPILTAIPSTWDDTRFVSGTVGQTVAIARKHGDRWWIGATTDRQAREVRLPLTFARSRPVPGRDPPGRRGLGTGMGHSPGGGRGGLGDPPIAPVGGADRLKPPQPRERRSVQPLRRPDERVVECRRNLRNLARITRMRSRRSCPFGAPAPAGLA